MLIPKQKPLRDKTHLAFIRTLPCVACLAPHKSQAAHIRRGGDGGTGIKPSDNRTISLCAKCHNFQHNSSELRFWNKYGGWERAVVLAKNLYKNTGNFEKCIEHIIAFRKVYENDLHT